jgi:hypothetical protein
MEDIGVIILIIVLVVFVIKLIIKFIKSIIKSIKKSLSAIANNRIRKRLIALYLQGEVHISYEEWIRNFDTKFTFKLRNPYISNIDVKDYKEITGENIIDIKEGDKLMIFPDEKSHELLKKNKFFRHNLYPKGSRQILLCTADKVIIGSIGSIKQMFDDQIYYQSLYEDLVNNMRWDVYVKEVRRNSDCVIDSVDIILFQYISSDELKNKIIECEQNLIELLDLFLKGYSRKIDYIIDGICITKEFDSSMKTLYSFLTKNENNKNEDFYLKFGFNSFAECYDYIHNLKNIIDIDCHYTGETVSIEYDNWSNYDCEPRIKNYKVGVIDYMFRTPKNNFMTVKVFTDYNKSGSYFYNLRESFKDYVSFGKSSMDLISVIQNKELERSETWMEKMRKTKQDCREFF